LHHTAENEFALGDPSASLKSCEQALEKLPQYEPVMMLYAKLLQVVGRHKEALTAFNRVKALGGHQNRGAVALGIARTLGHSDVVVSHLPYPLSSVPTSTQVPSPDKALQDALGRHFPHGLPATLLEFWDEAKELIVAADVLAWPVADLARSWEFLYPQAVGALQGELEQARAAFEEPQPSKGGKQLVVFKRTPEAGALMVCVGKDLWLVNDTLQDYSTRIHPNAKASAGWEHYWEERDVLRVRVEQEAMRVQVGGERDQTPTLDPKRLPVLNLALRDETLALLLGLASTVAIQRSNDSMQKMSQEVASLLPASIPGEREEKQAQDEAAVFIFFVNSFWRRI
jgi:hypothetical protein